MTQPFPCFTTRPFKNNECFYAGVIMRARGEGFSPGIKKKIKIQQLIVLVKFAILVFQHKIIFCPDPKGNIKRKIFLSLPRVDRCLMST